MAKSMTKAQIAEHMAQKTGLTKKAAVQLMEDFAALAYKEAKNVFTIPGIGKLVLANRKALSAFLHRLRKISPSIALPNAGGTISYSSLPVWVYGRCLSLTEASPSGNFEKLRDPCNFSRLTDLFSTVGASGALHAS